MNLKILEELGYKNCTPVGIDAYGEGVISVQRYRNTIGREGLVVEKATPGGENAWETIYKIGITPHSSADATLVEEERYLCSRENDRLSYYICHLLANWRVALRCLILAFFHFIHGILPFRWTEHERWMK